MALGAALAAAAGGGTELVVGESLGGARGVVSVITAGLVFYIVVSTPRRMIDGQRVSEARDSPLLSASAAACLAVTRSRPRTIILLRPRAPTLADSLREAGRMVLLGTDVSRALASASESLVSYTAGSTLRGLASFGAGAIDQEDDESRGLASSSDLARETKIPMLMTACFFTPILLVLYAVFSRTYSAQSLAELAALEFILLDLAYYLSSSELGSDER